MNAALDDIFPELKESEEKLKEFNVEEYYCTNDKGCVACENGELYEGKPTDCTKSNEEQAKKIAVKWKAKGLPYNAIYDSCLDMAEWKDEQFEEEKKELRCLVDMIPVNETNQTIIEDLKALLQ